MTDASGSTDPLAGLSAKEAAFVAEYLIDLSAAGAAERAGYSKRTARSQGCRLLTRPRVADAVAAMKDVRATRTGVTADRVLLELARVGLADIRQVMSWDEEGKVTLVPSGALHDDAAAAIQSLRQRTRTVTNEDGDEITTTELEVKLHAKDPALQGLARHLNLYQKDNESGQMGLVELLTAIARGEHR